MSLPSAELVYENVVRALLNESRMDSYARALAQKLVSATKRLMPRINQKIKADGKSVLAMKVERPSFLRQQGAPSQSLTLLINVTITAKRSDVDRISMSGSWSIDENAVYINIIVLSPDRAVQSKHLSMIQNRAYDVVRHELEHATQPNDKLTAGAEAGTEFMTVPDEAWSSPRKIYAYFASEAEVEAYVAGLYHAAKRQRRPFIELLDALIADMISNGIRRGTDARTLRDVFADVRNLYVRYAKKRFPKAVVHA